MPLLCRHESKSHECSAHQCPLGTFQALAVGRGVVRYLGQYVDCGSQVTSSRGESVAVGARVDDRSEIMSSPALNAFKHGT